MTIADLKRAAQIFSDHFSPEGCYGAFPVIDVTESDGSVILTARRWSESYISVDEAMTALPGWCERFNRDEEDGRNLLREAGLLH